MVSNPSWRPTVQHPDFEVSDTGIVRRSKPNPRTKVSSMTSLTVSPRGTVSLGTGRTYTVGRLVAEAFIPNPEGLPRVMHIDGDPQNNHPPNLRWVSHSDFARFTRMAESPTGMGPEKAQQIRDRVGTPYEDIATELSLPKSIVRNVLLGKSWRP